MKNYKFQEIISKEVLESYLSRAVTAADLVNSDTLEDDLRAIINIGAKFLGRSSGVWDMEPDDEEHFRKSQVLAERVHALDEEIILQTCIFEVIFTDVEKVNIPKWVFDAFDLIYEDRTFRYGEMLFDNGPIGYASNGTSAMPNIDKIETEMWFYFRAIRYIDAGFEAIHMGQIHLYTADDAGFKKTYRLFDMIREYAKKNARRHMVLLDAHTHGININGKLLFDFYSMPYSRMPILDVPGEKLALVREGYYEGGLTPSGWAAETLPMLMEFDNWGGKFFDDEDQIPYEQRAWLEWWGYDQITWFASQDEQSRNKYLEYTFKWTAINNINAYFQMPFKRTLGSCQIQMPSAASKGLELISNCYKANMPSESCSLGFGQEDTIKQIWASENNLRERAGNPPLINKFGADHNFDPLTGVKLPSRVILIGSFQHHLGAINHDSNSEVTRMYSVGDGVYRLSCVFPFKGEYQFAVAPYGTLSSIYSIDSYPRSGSSNKANLNIEQDNTVVVFTFNFITRNVETEIIEGM